MTLKNEINALVLSCLALVEASPTLKDDESLILSGRLSSIGLIELIAKLEAHYQIDLVSQGVNPLDFDSVEAIASLIQQALST